MKWWQPVDFLSLRMETALGKDILLVCGSGGGVDVHYLDLCPVASVNSAAPVYCEGKSNVRKCDPFSRLQQGRYDGEDLAIRE